MITSLLRAPASILTARYRSALPFGREHIINSNLYFMTKTIYNQDIKRFRNLRRARRIKMRITFIAWLFYTLCFVSSLLTTLDECISLDGHRQTIMLGIRTGAPVLVAALLLTIGSITVSIYCWKRLLEYWW